MVDTLDHNPRGLDNWAIRDAFLEVYRLYGDEGLEALVARYPGHASYHPSCSTFGPLEWIARHLHGVDPSSVAPRLVRLLGKRSNHVDELVLEYLISNPVDAVFEQLAEFLGSRDPIAAI